MLVALLIDGYATGTQMIKYRARGYRNEGRLERAILFHCSGLDLYSTHSQPEAPS